MARAADLAAVLRGGVSWNEWRVRERVERPDLSHADLRAVDLQGADLSHADLSGTNFAHSNLSRTSFNRAQVEGACFDDAILHEATFERAGVRSLLYPTRFRRASLVSASFANALVEDCDFTDADLHGASFLNAVLRRVTVEGARFRAASFGGTLISETDLRGAKELAATKHHSPSDIADAVERSRGKLPREFRLGSGIPENPALPNVFISYSHHDLKFADRIEAALQRRGVPCYRDIRDLYSGDLGEQLQRAILGCDVLLVILSRRALESEWVEHEVRVAAEREIRSGAMVLCPISLDDTWKDADWSAEVMKRINAKAIIDFAGWRSAAEFDRQFERVLRGLREEYTPKLRRSSGRPGFFA